MLHDVAALVLCEFLVRLLLHGMGEGDTREVLHDDVEVVVGLNDVVDLDDVGVIC